MTMTLAPLAIKGERRMLGYESGTSTTRLETTEMRRGPRSAPREVNKENPLAVWLDEAIEQSGHSPYAISEISGVTHARISQLLAAKTATVVKRDTLEKLAQATLPTSAASDSLLLMHHLNRALVANGMLPDPPAGGCIVVVRKEGALYLPGAPVDEVKVLRTGEEVEVYGSGRRLTLTDEFVRRIEFEAELEQGKSK
jgi:hypothetical protein